MRELGVGGWGVRGWDGGGGGGGGVCDCGDGGGMEVVVVVVGCSLWCVCVA